MRLRHLASLGLVAFASCAHQQPPPTEATAAASPLPWTCTALASGRKFDGAGATQLVARQIAIQECMKSFAPKLCEVSVDCSPSR